MSSLNKRASINEQVPLRGDGWPPDLRACLYITVYMSPFHVMNRCKCRTYIFCAIVIIIDKHFIWQSVQGIRIANDDSLAYAEHSAKTTGVPSLKACFELN